MTLPYITIQTISNLDSWCGIRVTVISSSKPALFIRLTEVIYAVQTHT